jgi:two-component system, sensor histidine kinase and response regulator
MDFTQTIVTVLAFLVGGVIAWQITARRSKAEQRRARDEDAQRIWHFLQHELKQVVATVRLMIDRLKPSVTNQSGKILLEQLSGQIKFFSDLTIACQTYATFLEFGIGKPEIVSLGEILEEVQTALLSYYPDSHIELQLSESTGPLNVYANPDQVKVIFRNLLDNAWKYSNKKDAVRVEAHSFQGKVIVDVINVGGGIDNETMTEILHGGGRRNLDPNIPGQGLGLDYTNRIVQANGGMLNYEKKRNGQLMRVILPAAPEPELEFSNPTLGSQS